MNNVSLFYLEGISEWKNFTPNQFISPMADTTFLQQYNFEKEVVDKFWIKFYFEISNARTV